MAYTAYLTFWIVQTASELEADFPVEAAPDAGSYGLLTLLAQTGPFARLIMGILLVFSVVSWGVILSKLLLIKKIRRESDTFWRIFRKAHNLSEVNTAVETLTATPLAPVFDAGYQMMAARPTPGSGRGGVLTETRAETSLRAIERVLGRAAANEISRLESSMTFLATTATVTPFIGLLGTVVGVISSFMGLASSNIGTLRAVAPGIADALIATALGLFAAIPAVMAYNHFVAQIRAIASQLDDLQAELLAVIEREQ